MGKYTRIGQILVNEKVINEEDLEHCLKKQKISGEPLGQIFINEGLLNEEQLLRVLGKQLDLSYVDLHQKQISQNALKEINENLARRYEIIPIEFENNTLTVAISDPLNMSVIDDLFMLTNYEIKIVIASKKDIDWAINCFYLPQGSKARFEEISKSVSSKKTDDLQEEELSDAPTINFVKSLIKRAVAMNASDIHIETHEKEMVVRYRIDGVLHDIMSFSDEMKETTISRLKVMANLRIIEKRKPQDGSFHIKVDGRTLDVRMSTIPTLFGEKVVLRLLEKDNVHKLSELGFQPSNLGLLKQLIHLPHGIILITGPTGSGKSTTLYAILNEINNQDKNIVTIEDPIEYVLPRVNQIQINPPAGLTFASGLRSILRQDPDIIMVGEIRDEETAKIAVQAALTGHLVLSTLHTNTAIGSVYRFLNMGIEPYLLAASIKGVISQRLVRNICPHCKTEICVEDDVLERVGSKNSLNGENIFYKGTGCFKCQNSGYKGRMGIQEVIKVDDELSSLINKQVSEQELKNVLSNKSWYVPLADDGIKKARNGNTTLEEVIRVVYF